MVVIKFATYTNRCPFSKKLIKPTNKICLFNQEQFVAFKRIINEKLILFLPLEIIDLIIEKTGYEKLLGRFGLVKVSHWTVKYTTNEHKFRTGNSRYIKYKKIIISDTESESDEDSD